MIWLLFILIFLATGILSWNRMLPKSPVVEKLLFGALLGLILSCFLPFFFAIFLNLNSAVFFSQLAAVCIIIFFVLRDTKNLIVASRKLKNFFAKWSLSKKILLIIFVAVLIPYLILVSRILFIENGWYTTGVVTAYGDVPFHLMYISSFVWGDNFPPQNPDFAGTPSDYPFLPYFTSAAIISLGAGLKTGFIFPAFLLSALIIALLFYVPWRVTREVWTAVLTPFLFLFCGGLGFFWFFQAHGLDIFSRVPKFPSAYLDAVTSISLANINFMNSILCALLPQRGILFGIPIFLAVILLWFKGDRRSIIMSAVLTATLPLLSAHTFIALAMAAFFSAVVQFWRKNRGGARFDFSAWVIYLAIISVAGLLVLIFFRPPLSGSSHFVRFTNGWMSDGENLFWYWFKNLGFFLPALLAALFWKKVPPVLKIWYLPFSAIFIVPNFILFSPWEFDNHKFFHLWYLVSSFLVAYFLVLLFRNRNPLMKIAAGVLLLLIVLSGGLEVARVWRFSEKGFQLFSPESQKTAEFIKQNIPPNEVVLASTSHLSPLIISGRKRIVGYTGWLAAHGVNYSERVSDIKNIYQGTADAEILLAKYNIKYILIGGQEKSEFSVNSSFFEENFRKIYDQSGYQIFRKD